MIRLAIVTLLAAQPVAAQTHDHAQHLPADSPHLSQNSAAGPRQHEAGAGPEHAADTLFGADTMAAARSALFREMTPGAVTKLMVDRAEAQLGSGPDAYLLDVQGWHGNSLDKLWLKAEIEGVLNARIFETRRGATLWTTSAETRAALARVELDPFRGGGDVDANAPVRVRFAVVRELVSQATADFQPRWVQQ